MLCLNIHVLLAVTSTRNHVSFSFTQELRIECYAQSLIAQGKSPASVDAVTSPEAVIPPLFNAYPDETEDTLPNEITMTE